MDITIKSKTEQKYDDDINYRLLLWVGQKSEKVAGMLVGLLFSGSSTS